MMIQPMQTTQPTQVLRRQMEEIKDKRGGKGEKQNLEQGVSISSSNS